MSALSDKIKGNWKQNQGKIKEEYGEATGNEVAYQEGQEDQLLGQLQEKMGKTKQEVKDWIDSF